MSPNRSGRTKLIYILVVALLLGVAVRFYLVSYSNRSTEQGPVGWTGINAPFITSKQRSIDKMVEIAELTENDVVYDLGCGDGRIVISAVKKSGCKGVGIDIEAQRIEESIASATTQGVADKIEFRQQDVFTVDLSECSVAMMYLTGWMIEKLEPQFAQMKPGSKVLTQDYYIQRVKPVKVVTVPSDDPETPESKHIIYLYKVPLEIDPTMERGKPPLITEEH